MEEEDLLPVEEPEYLAIRMLRYASMYFARDASRWIEIVLGDNVVCHVITFVINDAKKLVV